MTVKKPLSWKHNALGGQCLNILNVHRACLLICDQWQTGHLGHLSNNNPNDKNNCISCIFPWRKAIRSRVRFLPLSTTYQEQASRGHIQSNAALIVFAVFWTGHLSRYNAISNAGKKASQSFVKQWQ